MLRVVPFLLVLSAGCTEERAPLQRDGLGRAAGDAIATVPIYLELAGMLPAGTTLVTGTRDSFVVDGTVSSPSSGTAEVAGAGGTTENTLDMHLSVTLVAWRNEFWRVTFDGSLDVIEAATYGDPDAPLPTALIQHITGELEVSDEGRSAFDLALCFRGSGQPFGYDGFGMTGTVDGEPAVDHSDGFDTACQRVP